jgi:hypothetical protein
MKTTLSLILAGFALLFFQYSAAQAICGFDAVHARKMKEDPSYRKNVLAGETSIREYIRQHPIIAPATHHITTASGNPVIASGNPAATSANPVITSGGPTAHTLSGPPYSIPVVVHVIHTGGAIGTIYNPTDAQILGAIAYLNNVYNGSIPGTEGAGDLQIQFVVAQRDPNCNPTTGINRVDGSGLAGYVSGGVNNATTLGANDASVKGLIDWDHNQYYNVWIVNKIDGNDGTSGQFVAGYAYMPGIVANLDGIVMLATQMVAGQKTLPHEIGHAFNLYHPFNLSSQTTPCPSNSNCSAEGDQVCDTDPIAENINWTTGVIDFSCRTGQPNPCTGTNYNDSTESNYMNYTNCYNLFTNGQKARMLGSAAGAYRSGLTTSMGGLPPSAGGCGPMINFELNGDQQTESTAITSGCRSYRDYSYNMVIGVAPSATAIATLNVSSGTAVQGVDFDLTTNGNFTTPSQQLSFPSGSTASQPFTIRIYDDVSVNGTRNFTLGFTVNNGGGNAAAGNGIPNFAMTINDNDKAPAAGTATGTVTIGTISSGVTSTPFDATQASERTQFLYKASELTAAGIPAGSLSGISLDVFAKNSTRSFTNLTIKIGTAAAAYLINGATVTLGASMTVVKTLSSYTTVGGWNNFTFDNPYTWDGTSNLVVEICFDNGSTAAGTGDQVVFYSDGGASNQGNTIFQDGINCSQSFTSVGYFANGLKPTVKFSYGIPPTVVQTTLNSSGQQWLGPNSDLYFYDQVNGQLMARIRNLTGFNYGCTQVIIDRAGTNATQFWNTNTINYLMDKTFHVLPTTNNPSGSYNITLYYTQAEVNGWQSFTGQSIGSVQLVKVPSQILNVTAANPTGGGAVTLVTPSIATLGTNTALTYNFTNGFSGFGAGVPGLAPLPIGLLNFDGRLQGNDAILKWTTSFETNNKGFEIDRSFDGNNFSKIGFTAGAGNSATPLNYTFTDPSLTRDNNYYRLQQIDLDGKSVFSKIVLVNKDGGSSPSSFTVLSNPFTNSLDIVFGQVPAGKVQLRLLDITGRELLRQSGSASAGGRFHIDLSGTALSAGVYLLEARFDNKTQIEKLIKK